MDARHGGMAMTSSPTNADLGELVAELAGPSMAWSPAKAAHVMERAREALLAQQREIERLNKEIDAACDEAHREGYDEGQNDANVAAVETFKAVIAWGRKRDLFDPLDYPDGYTAQDVIDALGEHERGCIERAEARATAAEAEVAAMRSKLERAAEALEPFKAVFKINEPLSEGWPDDKPNSEFIPSVWPNWNDFRRAAAVHAELTSPLAPGGLTQ